MIIEGKTAVITGAASGIGQATAEELAKRGAKAIAMVDMDDKVETVTAKMNKKVGKDIGRPFQGDVTKDDFRKKVYDDMCGDYEVVNICVPSAGIFRDRLSVTVDKETGKADIYPTELFHKVLEVNLVHPVYWALELVARMAEHRKKEGKKSGIRTRRSRAPSSSSAPSPPRVTRGRFPTRPPRPGWKAPPRP